MTKINKIRKIERAVIVLVMLFAFLSPIVTKHVKFPEGSEMPEVPWYNPELADFLYDNTVDQTTYNFNAYNESYILCNIQNTAYANFTFNSSMYNVSYGINVIPIDFGVINQSYSIDIAQYDIDNDIFDWICVQPLIIKEESIEVNLATTTDRTFDAGGAITLLVQANFSYNWLEIEVDDIKINEIHDTSTYVEVDSVFLSVIRYGGIYIPYDMFLSPGQHIVKFRGNGSINYKIMCSYDWDDDYISDVEEIQRQDVETFLDPVEANIWGFFELGDSRVHAYDLDFQFGSYLVYIPESCGDDNFLRINVHMGSIGDVRVDNDKLMLMDSSISSFYGQISSGYYGKISAGFHSIQYNYTQQGITEVSFSINGVAISTLDKPEALDSDADGVKNVNEQKYGLNIYGIDTDCDRLVDSVDTSPVSAVYLDNDNITRIVIPHEENMTTQVTMSIGIPEDDYTTYEGTEIWRAGDEGGLEVSITPVLRLFGNSSISVSELKDIWDKKMVTYNLTESVCPDNGDGLPEGFEQNGEVALILPAFSKYSFDFNFYYGVNNTAKDNSNIDMRFDVVWLVLSHEANVTEVIHFYDFNEDIILQAFSVREYDLLNYTLANPDSMVETQIIWNLVQNPDLGSFSDFEVYDDIETTGAVEFFELQNKLDNYRDANPITVDESGNINETEVIFVSTNFTNSDILYEITELLNYNGIIPETMKYYGKGSSFVSYYYVNGIEDITATGEIDDLSDKSNGDYKVCYTQIYGNHSGTSSPFEERLSINSYPIYMNRITTFNGAEVLEISDIIGQDIPLDKLPDSRGELNYDKLVYINTTIIEKDDDGTGVPHLGYDYKEDEYKEMWDDRIFNIPLSDLIFNEYPLSYAIYLTVYHTYLYNVVTLYFQFYLESGSDALIFELGVRVIAQIVSSWYDANQIFGDQFLNGILNLYDITDIQMDALLEMRLHNPNFGEIFAGTADDFFTLTESSLGSVWDQFFDIVWDAFDSSLTPAEQLANLERLFQYILARRMMEDMMESWLDEEMLLEMRPDEEFMMGRMLGQYIEAMEYMADDLSDRIIEQELMLRVVQQIEMAKRAMAIIGKIMALFQKIHMRLRCGVFFVAYGIYLIIVSVMDLQEAAKYKDVDPLLFLSRIHTGLIKLAMGIITFTTGLYYMALGMASQAVAESIDRALKVLGKYTKIVYTILSWVQFIFDIVWIFNSDLTEDEKWRQFTFSLLNLIFNWFIPILCIWANIPGVGWIIAIFASLILMALNPPIFGIPYFTLFGRVAIDEEEEYTFLTFPEHLKTHGGLTVGDTIGLNITVTNNDPDNNHRFYANFSAGGSDYTDYEGDWGSGYEPDESEMLNFTRVLPSAQTHLNLGIGAKSQVYLVDEWVPLYNDIQNIQFDKPILDVDITDFVDDLTDYDRPKEYQDLLDIFNKHRSTYEHYTTAETTDKLSNRLKYDFLSDDVEDDPPQDWYVDANNDSEFTVILRPNEDHTTEWEYPYPENDAYIMVNDEVVAPLPFNIPDDLISTQNEGGPYKLEIFNCTEPSDVLRVKSVTIHAYGMNGYRDVDVESYLAWRFNDTADWSTIETVVFGEYGEDEHYKWQNHTWVLDEPNNLSEFQILMGEPDTDWEPLAEVYVQAIYAEIVVVKDITSGYASELETYYKGHNNVMNITAFGSNARTDFYNNFTAKTSDTIDFWLCKDMYSNFIFDKFFEIDRTGSILEFDGETMIREKPIKNDEWTHFSVDFSGGTFDLYINGRKVADAVDYDDTSSLTKANFSVYNRYYFEDMTMYNLSVCYIDAVDYFWDTDYYQWRSYAWDYSVANITTYETYRGNMDINTSISTDLGENIVEMNLDTDEAIFSFDLDLVGIENPAVDIDIFNIPDGFSVNDSSMDQNLGDTINFKITDNGTLNYAGIYYFEMNITLDEESDIIYHEVIKFRIPLVEDLTFSQPSVIYETFDVDGNYTSKYDFLGDTVGENPAGWSLNEGGGDIDVIAELDGHENVVEMDDASSSGLCTMQDGFTDQTTGTIEFWYNTDTGANQKFQFAGFTPTAMSIWIQHFSNGELKSYTGSSWDTITTLEFNKWYHIRFDFDCNSDTFDVYIDGILTGIDMNFKELATHVDTFQVITTTTGTGKIYIDAVGYSWDSDYIPGENMYTTDTIIPDITESQVAKGDIVDIDFITNTYSEVQMKFVNNDVVQETYIILPRGNNYRMIQSNSFMVDTSITFDEIRFTDYEYNYFDVLQIQITDTLGTVGTSFNPVNITNDGNIPEYVQFDILGVDPENIYSESSPGTVANVDRNGNANWTNVNNVKTQDDSYGLSTIEITSPPNVKSVEHVELTLSGVTSNYVALTKDQNLANCVPFVSQKIDTTGDDWDENMVDLYFESSPSKRITGQRGEGSGTVMLSIYIVEFDGVNVEVQSGTFSTSGTYDEVDITAITQSKAFPMAYWRISGNDDDWDCAMITTDFVDSDTIRMERDQATGTINGHWYVVEAQNTEFSVQKAEMSMSTSDDFDTDTISSVTMSKSFVVGSYEADVRNEDVEEGGVDIWLSSSTQVRAERRPEAGSYAIPTINVFVITFSGDESVQRGSFTWSNSDTSKSVDINAVDLANAMIKSGSMLGIMECDGGGGDDPEDGFIQYEFVDTNTVRGERMGSTGEDGTGHWEVVEWIVGSDGASKTESDWLRCTNFNFNIPDDAVIIGIAVEIDEYTSTADSIKDYSVRLRKPNGEISTDRKSLQYWDTTDDDLYNIHGSMNDTWDLDLSYDDVMNSNFGIDIAVENLGATSIAYIDHIIVKVYYASSFTIEILPGETIDVDFDIVVPTESINNIIRRGITYQTLGDNIVNRYTDNFEIDGIFISSLLNTTYNIIGNNLSCDKDKLSLEIIPEDTLVWSAYSLNGAANITFTGSANVTIPETNGVYTIQVFGNNSVGTMFESEIKSFRVNYPIYIWRINNNTVLYDTLNLVNTSVHSIYGCSNYAYSLHERPKQNIEDNNLLIQYIPYGRREIVIYGDDFYGDEYTSGLIHFDVALERVSASQPDDFDFTKGELLEPHGDLNYIDGNYSIFRYGDIAEYSAGIIIPNGDITTEWTYPTSGSHYTQIDEYPIIDTNDKIQPVTTDSGNVEEFSMTTKTLPIGAKITKVSVWYHSAAFLTGDTAPRISWNNGSSWSSYDNTPDFDNRTGGPLNNTGYVRTDFTGLDKGQSDLDLFAIGLVAQLVDPPPPMTGIIVNTLWAEIFYEVEALDVEVNMTVNDEDLYEVEALQYSHKTNVSAIVDLDIWDWKADQWDEIESIDNTATFNDRYVALGNSSDYLNSTNGVRVRYQSLGAAQLELDSMNLLYSTILVPDNLYLSPIQPDNFTMAKGSLETPYGELATINGNYTIVKSEAVGSGGQWTSSVSPDWDYETQWNDGASTPHWDKVDEDPDNPDGNNVQEAYTSNLYDRYGFEDVSVEGGEVTQVKLRILFFRIGTGTPQVNLYFDGAYQGWKNLISNPVTPQEYTWTGLSGDQTDVDNMQVRFRSSCMGTGPKTNTIYALEALVYYQTPRYDVDFQIDLQIDDEYCYFPNSISYSFKTNVSATIDFDIWDWTTETWYEIESVNNYATFDYDLFVLDMGSNYVNSTNGIRIRFQCLDNENDFQLEIDQLRLDYYYVEP